MGRPRLLQEVWHAAVLPLARARLLRSVAEALDERDGFTFVNQIFIDEKPPYYDFANATKTMTGAEVAAAFAPPTEKGGA